MNALKHGERSARTRGAWRELNAALRTLKQQDQEQSLALDGIVPPTPTTLSRTWMIRIAHELKLSSFSENLLLSLFCQDTEARNRFDD
jgi:hypothetical protein